MYLCHCVSCVCVCKVTLNPRSLCFMGHCVILGLCHARVTVNPETHVFVYPGSLRFLGHRISLVTVNPAS